MNKDVVKRLNQLQVEKAELKSAVKSIDLDDEASKEEKVEYEKEIATIDHDILSLGSHLMDEDFIIEEAEYDEDDYESEEVVEE